MSRVELYGRPGCHLCEEALGVLLRVRERIPFVLAEIDIETDSELLRRYLERIPVVTVDAAEVFEFFVDEAELERRLTRTAAPSGVSRVQRG